MIELKLNDAEEKLLAETIDTSLGRLRDEIAHTDARDYRDFLKQRKEVLLKLREKLH